MRRLRYTIITAMLTWAMLTQAQTIALRLDSLMLDPLFETTQVGMMVHDLTTDQTLYTRGQRQLLRPASTMKLLTAITALRELGADYRVTTQLYTQGTIADSTFTGNIYCHGSLDPAFGDEDMNILIDSLRLAGINAINALTAGKAEIFSVAGARIPSLQKGVNIIRTADGKTTKVLVK